MADDLILERQRLGAPPWPTRDPFLFCVHHLDRYPEGDARMAPKASLAGRRIGMDFEGKDGWRMYHGDVVPGFPVHPHRGFETVTVARQGHIDHADSLGATARFGQGDCQWMTAGRGIQHSEMFPLLSEDSPNPGELFQIWLNLPRADKMVDPHFTMLWDHSIPRRVFGGDAKTMVRVVAGALEADGERSTPGDPPPNSWASKPDSHVAIWTMQMEPGARWTLPLADPRADRTLYFFAGSELTVGAETVETGHRLVLRSGVEVPLVNGDAPAEILLLQGRPIGEPVSHYGPFVMNTDREIHEAMADYRQTQFGGWPWGSPGPVHERGAGRFAIHADGRKEEPKQ